MFNGIWIKRIAVVTALSLSACIPNLQAQMGTATLSGLVTDPSGAIVPKATVVLESTERKFTRRSSADELGGYIFTALPPGAYQLPRLPVSRKRRSPMFRYPPGRPAH
jgi:hypothetical protein